MSAFTIFAAYGGRQHALVLRKQAQRDQLDAFPEIAADDNPSGDERYTTRETIEWCKARVGVDAFDLDVAACEESHWAKRYYTKTEDGLVRPWGGRVWCNPPYSDIEPWVRRADAAVRGDPSTYDAADVVAMLIPATRTEQPWWHKFIEPFRDRPDGALRSHFVPGRTSFARPGSGGVGQSSAPFGCVLLIWRRE